MRLRLPKRWLHVAGAFCLLLTPSLGTSATLEQIREAQHLLALLGYDVGEVDGQMNPSTRGAIGAFEADFGIPSSNGEVTDSLLALLRPIADDGSIPEEAPPVRSPTAVQPPSNSGGNANDNPPAQQQNNQLLPFSEPAMTNVPAGCFLMGSPEAEPGRYRDEGPQREVCIEQTFSMSTFEVTNAEFRAFRPAHNSGEGFNANEQPVARVSWQDAVAYTQWLSERTAQNYHLPSEAQWEHAARAGSTTRYWWGENIERGYANCDGCGSRWDNATTAPVGSFLPNPWGLYDTTGNVLEWVRDAYHDYRGARVDGTAYDGNGGARVLRGGAFDSIVLGHGDIRSANRFYADPKSRLANAGFRIAKSPSASK